MIHVGVIVNEYLILKFQSPNAAAETITDLRSGTSVLARSVVSHETLTAVTFPTTVLSISKLREPVILIGYPRKIETQQLRTSPRIAIELMATIRYPQNGVEHLVLVTDFSMTGLKCEYSLNEDEEEPKPEQLEELAVEIEFSDSDDLDISMVLVGKIKNTRIKDKVCIGVAFDENKLNDVKSAFTILLMRQYGL